MTDWTTFAAVTGVVLALLLALARVSRPTASGGAGGPPASEPQSNPESESRPGASPEFGVDAAPGPGPAFPRDQGVGTLPPGALLFSVALSQGLFASLLVFAAWWTRLPLGALGLAPAFSLRLLGLGVGLGVALWVANHVAGRAGERAGISSGEELRAALAPASARGWAVLLAGVLPLIAGFEEFLFRAALVGALSAGFGVSPWALAVGSSVAFALGHGAQGRVGMAVTGGLGFGLAAGFVLTDSLLVVAVAHYLVNALEFLVRERPGAD